jgi:tetratricopeptide (TPR) repeat protein
VNRSAILLAAVFVLGVIAFMIHQRSAPERIPPVPMGKTVTQVLPDASGKPQVWKLTKREVPLEKLPDMVLPRPKPRTRPPDPERAESARALNGEALESWRHGDVKSALGKFEAAVKADPDDAEPRTQYGRLLTLMTDYERAYPQLARAAELKPEDPQVWLDLATLYEKSVLLERAQYARQRAERLARGAKIERDENGFYFLEGGKLFP